MHKHEMPPIGRYLIEKELGKGATGTVYLGRDPESGTQVAIKVMALSQASGAEPPKEIRERLFREAETAGRLVHPHIVRVYDAGESQGRAFIAMEFFKGEDLTLHAKPDNLLPVEILLSILARVAEALSFAHRNGVVHRDIKPANILYEPGTDSVKVTDFGIAGVMDASTTRSGEVHGTPSYMSPEQLAGRNVDGRSDLFSLGATLYQLACGRLPFAGDTMGKLLFNIANEPHADIRVHDPRLPACLAAIVDRSLAKDPDRRYQNGEQMATALRLCLQSLAGTRRPAKRSGSAASAVSATS